MPGWGKLVVGALIGVAGTVYATNEELRKQLPRGARDLPVALRKRFENAVQAGREASSDRRAEILRALEEHEAAERARSTAPAAPAPAAPAPSDPAATAPPVAAPATEPKTSAVDTSSRSDTVVAAASEDEDATRPLRRFDESS